MDFFEPRILNLRSIDGKAIGEFPILYYLTAVFYKIFGEHEFILRLINLTIVTTGLLYLYKLLLKLLSDIAYALTFTFLFFSSTILIYYSNNYLPDPAAFGFTLIGWYFYYEFFSNQKNTTALILSLFLFTLATLLKVSYGINLSAAFLSLVVWNTIYERTFSIKKEYPYLLSFIFSFLIIAAWYLFVIVYNDTNNATYFLTHNKAIWTLNSIQLSDVWDHISNYWYTKYYYESTIHVYLVLLIAGFFFIKKSNKIILTFAITTTIGSLIYFVLFYSQFRNHDYYFIALIPVIIFLVINSFISIRNKYPKIIGNIFFKLALITLLVLSLNYARKKVNDRYNDKDDKFASIGWQLAGVEEYITSIGVSDSAKIVVISDFTPNGSLYFLNRRGWTLQDTSDPSIDNIDAYIKEGASYLILTDKNYLNNSIIKQKAKGISGEYNNVIICNLDSFSNIDYFYQPE